VVFPLSRVVVFYTVTEAVASSIQRAVAVAEVAVANADVGVGVNVFVFVAVGSVCLWRGPERQRWRNGNGKAMSGKQVAWVVGLARGLGSENGDTGIGSARGCGERGRGDATRVRTNGTGGDSGEEARENEAECRENEGWRL